MTQVLHLVFWVFPAYFVVSAYFELRVARGDAVLRKRQEAWVKLVLDLILAGTATFLTLMR